MNTLSSLERWILGVLQILGFNLVSSPFLFRIRIIRIDKTQNTEITKKTTRFGTNTTSWNSSFGGKSTLVKNVKGYPTNSGPSTGVLSDILMNVIGKNNIIVSKEDNIQLKGFYSNSFIKSTPTPL